MAELIPLIGGSLAGALCARYLAGRARWLALGAASLAVALLAGLVSGELARSAGFLLWDLAQALAAGGLAALAVLRPRSRRA